MEIENIKAGLLDFHSWEIQIIDKLDDEVLWQALDSFAYEFMMEIRAKTILLEIGKMNDIDDIREDLYDLGCRISQLECAEDDRPYYLYVYDGSKRKCIGVFSTRKLLDSFIMECELKVHKKNQRYKKNSPLYGWDDIKIEREYVPEHILVNPKAWEI